MGQWGIGTTLTDTLIHSEPEPETLLLLQLPDKTVQTWEGDPQIFQDPQLYMKSEI